MDRFVSFGQNHPEINEIRKRTNLIGDKLISEGCWVSKVQTENKMDTSGLWSPIRIKHIKWSWGFFPLVQPRPLSWMHAFCCSSDLCAVTLRIHLQTHRLCARFITAVHHHHHLRHNTHTHCETLLYFRTNHRQLKMGRIYGWLKYLLIFFNVLLIVSRKSSIVF